MMGERRVAQKALFYEFSLEEHVPADHLLRSIESRRFPDETRTDDDVRIADVPGHLVAQAIQDSKAGQDCPPVSAVFH